LLQDVVRYVVKQYFYIIGKIAYLKIVTYIIEMMYCWLYIMSGIAPMVHHPVTQIRPTQS
jgi:hypothetical protein